MAGNSKKTQTSKIAGPDWQVAKARFCGRGGAVVESVGGVTRRP
jgi:hypothetical protein